MLVRVQRLFYFDNSTLAVDCSDEVFRTIEALLHQAWHITIVNEPLRVAQQTQGLKGLEAWHAIVRRYDQWNIQQRQ